MSKKFTDLTALTTPDPADVLPVDDVSANVTKKTTVAGLAAGIADSPGVFHDETGWVPASETFTYVSATSFKVTGTDVTDKFPVGTRIKLTQTTVKYFYVTSTSFSTDTTVNITAGSDYTLANAAITSPMYSYMATPQGFPSFFAYTPTLSGSGGSPTIGNGTLTGRFAMRGKLVALSVALTNGTTTAFGSSSTTLSLPVTATATSRAPQLFGETLDASPAASYIIACFITSTTTMQLNVIGVGGTYAGYSNVSSSVPITPANSDSTKIWGTYEAA